MACHHGYLDAVYRLMASGRSHVQPKGTRRKPRGIRGTLVPRFSSRVRTLLTGTYAQSRVPALSRGQAWCLCVEQPGTLGAPPPFPAPPVPSLCWLALEAAAAKQGLAKVHDASFVARQLQSFAGSSFPPAFPVPLSKRKPPTYLTYTRSSRMLQTRYLFEEP